MNVAARARGTPNLALRNAASDPRISPFLDQLVRFEVTPDGFSMRTATLEEAQAYWDSRVGEPLVPEADDAFGGLPDFDELGFDDSIRVGVKAANLSELHHLLGDTAPIGFAVPFSAYDAYMSENRVTDALCEAARVDCEEEGRAAALCAAAGARCAASADASDTFYGLLERLLGDPELSTDTALREASLNALRYLVHNGAVDPDFARNGLVFWTFAEPGEGGNSTAVARGRLDGDRLTEVRTIFSQKPKVSSRHHCGSRIVFGRDGTLWVGLGDRFSRKDDAQNPANHLGKVIRIDREGRAPADNPKLAAAEVWSLGHRNIQGAAAHPASGAGANTAKASSA